MNYLTEVLDKSHNRKGFKCGKKSLDNYIQQQVSQDIKRKLCLCFVLMDKEQTDRLIGYYTLSNSSIKLADVRETYRKKMPKSYKNLPTTLLGRLAVDKRYTGKGYGKLLLIDSLKRSYEASQKIIGSMAVIVDPLDLVAEQFYEQYGFEKLPDSGKMFLSMRTISKLFKE